VHELGLGDFASHLQFVQWVFNEVSHVSFMDEAYFTQDRYFNSRNSHVSDDVNPLAVFVRVHQQRRFSVNIWAKIVNNLLGPVILPTHLNGAAYLEVLQSMLLLLMENAPLMMCRDMWFQHDGAPPHFSLVVRSHLNNTYGEQWIGRMGHAA
jgi:hypothetical protein